MAQGDLEIRRTLHFNREIRRSGEHFISQQGDLEIRRTLHFNREIGRSGERLRHSQGDRAIVSG
jgi:hypothetical protein